MQNLNCEPQFRRAFGKTRQRLECPLFVIGEAFDHATAIGSRCTDSGGPEVQFPKLLIGSVVAFACVCLTWIVSGSHGFRLHESTSILPAPAVVMGTPTAPAVEPAVEPVKPVVDELPTSPVSSQMATQSKPVLKSAKDRGSTPSTAAKSTEAAASGDMTKQQQDFKDCLDAWDKGTHMTKQNWRSTCERTIRDYPERP
jgi:hypothetical protein